MPVLFLVISGCGQNTSTDKTNRKSVSVAGVPPGTIVIDGRANDWENVSAITPQVGLTDRGEMPPKIDLHSVKVTHDNKYIYFLLQAQPSGGGVVEIYVDADGEKATGTSIPVVEKVVLDAGWDFVIKLTYAAGPVLTTQVEKFIVLPNGYKSELAFEHKNSWEDRSYTATSRQFQEFRIPLNAMNMTPPTDVAFLFTEGWGGMRTKFDKHCQFIKATLEK